MRFKFDEKKTAQAAAFLINRHGGQLNYMALIKLLYLADRRALIETGSPITGDRWVIMPHGPVLSMVLNLINMGKEPGSNGIWFKYVPITIGYSVESAGLDDTSELSAFELELLEDVDTRFGKLDRFKLRDITHELPEWEDPQGSSIPLNPADVLRAEDFSEEAIREIHADAEEFRFLSSLGSLGERR